MSPELRPELLMILSTAEELAVCVDDADQRWPAASGKTVVWEDYRNNNWDIYGLTIPEPAVLSLLGLGGVALLRRRAAST